MALQCLLLTAVAVGGASVTRADEPAAAPAAPAAPPRMRVGVAGSAPFVFHKDDELDGIAVRIWRELATRAGLTYDLLPQPNVATALSKVTDGTLDVAIGPISITEERAKRVSFTQPYYQSSLAIAAVKQSPSLWHKLSPFFSRAFLIGAGTLFGVLLVVGLLLWAVERRRNAAQFPAHPLHGIGNGIWLALVTMTTVGYGDRAPVTLSGRLITGLWMLIAMVTASSLTAGIASVLTVAQLEGGTIERAEQLAGVRTASVGGTTGERFARRYGARMVIAPDLPSALASVAAHEAEAVVFDRPALRYHLLNHPELDISTSSFTYQPQGYGFASARGSALSHQLSVALLGIMEVGRVDDIVKEYLGSEEH